MNDITPLIKIRNLHFKRGQRLIFNGIDMDIPRGKITAIMGPSGTGKTTLLRLIGGQIKPNQGTAQPYRGGGAPIPGLGRRLMVNAGYRF